VSPQIGVISEPEYVVGTQTRDKPVSSAMARMEPQPTPVAAPIHLRIADDLRMQIERGNLQPGASLPTLARPG
jgi:hypothetical protein